MNDFMYMIKGAARHEFGQDAQIRRFRHTPQIEDNVGMPYLCKQLGLIQKFSSQLLCNLRIKQPFDCHSTSLPNSLVNNAKPSPSELGLLHFDRGIWYFMQVHNRHNVQSSGRTFLDFHGSCCCSRSSPTAHAFSSQLGFQVS